MKKILLPFLPLFMLCTTSVLYSQNLTFYNFRFQFDLASKNQRLEDFEAATTTLPCAEPVNSTSANCFALGGLIDGYSLNTIYTGTTFPNTPANERINVASTTVFPIVPSQSIYPQTNQHHFEITFPNNDVYAVAFEHFDQWNRQLDIQNAGTPGAPTVSRQPITIRVYATSGSLIGTETYTQNYPNTNQVGQTLFMGFTSTQVIGRIEVQCAGFEVIDNLTLAETRTGIPPDINNCRPFSFVGACNSNVNPNAPDPTWRPIPASGILPVSIGSPGQNFVLNLSCITDDVDPLGALEYSLLESIELNLNCNVTLIRNSYRIRDIEGNIALIPVRALATFDPCTPPPPPVVNCTEFTETFFDCPDAYGANTPNGDWLPVPSSGIINTAIGGRFSSSLDLNSCVTYNTGSIGDLDVVLSASYEENTIPGCSTDIINVLQVRDRCGSVTRPEMA